MAGSYYPEYYLRKKARDRRYALLTRVVGAIVVLGLLGIVSGYLIFTYVLQPRKVPPGVNERLAEERSTLETQQALGAAPTRPETAPASGADLEALGHADLAEVEYSQSFPLAQVSLEGAEEGAPPLPDGGGADEAGGAAPGDGTATGESESETARPPSPPEERDRDDAFERSEPRDEGGTGAQPSATPDTGSESPPPAESEPEAAPPEPPADEQPAEPPAEVTVRWRVYAGSFLTREAAEGRLGDLTVMGLKGTVIQSGGDFHLLVTELTEDEQAVALHRKLVDSGFPNAFVTRVKN